ncbi:MAG: YebC/PmpR family DNA-binding transcriptional regulator [Oscillospiraceae bacterium]|nr:YebC/PmpR family DNA-binding transcriptional regulator [Oscillospiraceae bacterium]
MEFGRAMSGHSKWNNIKRKKEKTDAQKSKVFAKISREIMVCIRERGPDPKSNLKLIELVAKARANNIPAENIDKLIARVAGNIDKANYEEIVYEGCGPSGIAVIVRTLTDNRNRTAGGLRHYFSKFGGKLGQFGCVSYLFYEVGMIVIEGALDADEFMADVVELDIKDFEVNEELAFVTTEPEKLMVVKGMLSGKYKVMDSGFERKPFSFVRVGDEAALEKFRLLLNALEDNDDVQDIWHNLEE